MGSRVPRTDLSLPSFSLSALSFISLCSLHSTCCPATSQLPPAFKVALAGVRGEGGLPRLLASSSLNSRLGTQDGPARSPRRSGLHRALASAQESCWLSSSSFGFSRGHCSDGCPLERERVGEEGCRIQPSPCGGTLGSHSRAGSPSGEQLPGWSRADLLQNLGRPGMRRVESKGLGDEELGDSGCKWKGRRLRIKTWVLGNKEEKRGEENLSGASVTTPFPR